MALNDVSKNLMLTTLIGVATKVALLNDSLVEISGGSPAYARKTITWGTPVTGSVAMTGSLVFDVPAAAVVSYVRLYNTAGDTQYGDFDVTNETYAGQGTYTITAFTLNLNK